MEQESNILFEMVEEHIAKITLNRPHAANAICLDMHRNLRKVLEQIDADDNIRCVIITGAGEKAFAAGADIAEMQNFSAHEGAALAKMGNDNYLFIEDIGKPFIAAINGVAFGGGCEMTMACDFRIAAENAVFSQPEVNLGVIPGWGGSQRMARIIGVTKAKEMLFLGARMKAPEALECGLVNKVVPLDQLMDTAMDYARKLAALPPVAIRSLKAAMNRGAQCDIKTGVSIEVELFGKCFATEDQKNAMAAFLKKEKPGKFMGR